MGPVCAAWREPRPWHRLFLLKVAWTPRRIEFGLSSASWAETFHSFGATLNIYLFNTGPLRLIACDDASWWGISACTADVRFLWPLCSQMGERAVHAWSGWLRHLLLLVNSRPESISGTHFSLRFVFSLLCFVLAFVCLVCHLICVLSYNVVRV